MHIPVAGLTFPPPFPPTPAFTNSEPGATSLRHPTMELAFSVSSLAVSLKVKVVVGDVVEANGDDEADSLLSVNSRKISHSTPLGRPCKRSNTDSSVE